MPVYPSGGTIAQSAGSPGFGPAPAPVFNASGSVRFNPADTAYFSYTPTLEGSRTTWTMAFWVKRSALSTRQFLFCNMDSTSSVGFQMEFNASDVIDLSNYSASAFQFRLVTTQVFRDVTNWYHITLACDTTQSTNSNRLKLYVNGVQVTAFSTATYPTQYFLGLWNRSGVFSTFGKPGANPASLYFNGYLADANFVDGLALTPSSFTATDANTGQLVPAQYTGAFGINGFYLPFSGAALAADLGQNQKTTGQDYPQWPYNTLLVDTTNTNGQQNNTFLDSSTNNFTVTRNGNTTQGNFSPFTFGGGTTQANGYYSGYLDGSGDFINFSNRSAAGSFTCECWFWRGDNVTQYHTIFSGSNTANPNANNTQLMVTNTGAVTFVLVGVAIITAAGTAVAQYQWNHIAYVRSGTSCAVFVNGQRVGTGTSSGALNVDRIGTAGGQAAGSYDARGYISNARITDSAVYNPALTSITVPTTPLTNIANTLLLTCQSSQFIDNSTNALAITANGNAQPAPANPFGMTAWSGYFDGTGDYLTTASSSNLALGSGDFTIEMWVNPTNTSAAYRALIASDAYDLTVNGWTVYQNGASIEMYYVQTVGGATPNIFTATSVLTANVWQHVAISRASGTLRCFVNGVQVASVSNSLNFVGNSIFIGDNNAGSYFFNGLLSNVRIVKGTALYTANFTVPTAPLTAISGTQLLTCQSSTFVDNSTNAFAINVFGNSYTGTLNNPFNSPANSTPPVQGWSAYNPINSAFEPARGYITLPTSTNLALGSGDFCVEFFVYSSVGYGMSNAFCGNFFSAGAGAFYIDTSTNSGAVGPVSVRFANTDGFLITSPVMLRLNQWFHIAVCRTAGTLSMFINGNRVGSVANTYNFSNGTGMELFRGNINAPNRAPGYMSNFRLVKGRSPYNAGLTTLTVPTEPLQAIPGTQLLTLQSNQLVDNSPNRFPLTLVTVEAPGITPVTPNSPFLPTTAYSAASYGGSMYFDGNGDYLLVADNVALQAGSGDFTLEFWINYSSIAGYQTPYDKGYTNIGALLLQTGNGNGRIVVYASGTAVITETGTATANTWIHYALVRKGTTLSLYRDGALSGSATNSTNFNNSNQLGIAAAGTAPPGGSVGQYPVNGYMSGFRFVKGTAVYTTPFVLPVLPPTSISNTSLLLNATNSGIYDATGKNVIETVGNAQVSTAVKKFGESSMYFDGSGDYLVIPPRVELYLSTNQQLSYTNKDFTIEFWMYPTTVGSSQSIITRRSAQTARGFIVSISSGGVLFVGFGDASTAAWEYSFTSSAGAIAANTWQHVAVTRLGATYRTFVNGALLNSAAPSAFLVADDTSPIWIGQNGNEATPSPFNGYLQDVRFTIGAARYQGAFTPPAAAFAYNQYDIGNQQWSPNNISVTAGVGQDNLFDSPSDYGTDTGLGGQVRGNYATLNPLQNGGVTLTNGNLDGTSAPANWITTYATIGISTGKWYWEGTCTRSSANEALMGIVKAGATLSSYVGFDANGWCYYTSASSSLKINNASTSAYGAIYTTGDVIGVALDLDAGTLVFYKNGVSQGTAYSSLSGQFFPAISVISNSAWVMNFGQRAFAYAAPAGFKCLVSTNLPTPTIGTTSSTQANDYFDVALYTGTNATQNITTLGLQPDLVWIKGRSFASNHVLTDAVRGVSKQVFSSLTNAETTEAGKGVTAFNSNGFTLGPDLTVTGSTNASTQTYVAWNWKANGAGVANTDGTIPSTVSANTTSGCSIVTYTGNGSASQTVGHGLGIKPSMIILKDRNTNSSNNDWWVAHVGIPSSYIFLNTTAAAASASATSNGAIQQTNATSSVITFTNGSVNSVNVNESGDNYVAYCFAEVSGFSKFGTYTGNGSAEGPFVFCNFEPMYVLIKESSAAGNNWRVFDGKRNTYNVTNLRLSPSVADAEATETFADFVSNGFKIRTTTAGINASGSTFIFAAFAEFPFKYSRAR